MRHRARRALLAATVSTALAGSVLALAPAALAASAPGVTSVSPTTGSTAGGTRVTVHGARFSHVRSVKFGSSAGSSIRVLSSGTLQVTAPRHAAGRVDVRVTTSAGTSPAHAADRFTYGPSPVVKSVTPNAGKTAGGLVVTLTGSNFSHASRVLFGSTAGGSLKVLSATSLRVTSPKHATGTVDLRVVTPFGTSATTSADRFTFIPPPAITALAPSAGSVDGNTTVKIIGTALAGATAVTLDGANRPLTQVSGTEVDVTAPAHAHGPVLVVVTTPYGTSAAATYTYSTGPVTQVTASATRSSVELAWTNPSDASFTGVTIRRAVGPTPPASPTAGTAVATDPAPTTTSTTDSAVAPNTQYSYALFAHDDTYPSAAATRTITTPPLSPVTDVVAAPTTTTIALTWTNPADDEFSGVTVRRATGTTAPATPTAGTGVYNGAGESFTDTGRAAGTTYSYALFAHDAAGHYAAVVRKTVTTHGTSTPAAPSIRGTVTAKSGGAHVGGVLVTAAINLGGAVSGSTTTATDGTYTLTGVKAGTSYFVCFDPRQAAGAPVGGYVRQCYPHQITPSGTVAATGVDAQLVVGAAISGTVQATAEGGGSTLAGVTVYAFDLATDSVATTVSSTRTAADGQYQISGVPQSDSGYGVCFDARRASGGTSTTGYQDRCYTDVAWDGSPVAPHGATPVTVTGGVLTDHVDGALPPGAAVSGQVTAAQGGGALEGVRVYVYDLATGSIATSQSAATTSATGRYTVKGLQAGTGKYGVCFGAPAADGGGSVSGYQDQCYDNKPWAENQEPPADVVPVGADAGQVATGIDARLVDAGAISGRVTAASGGGGLAKADVIVWTAAGDWETSAVSGADGSYTVFGLPPSTTGYKVCALGQFATGGSSISGYLSACYDHVAWDPSQDVPATAAKIPVAAGELVTGKNIALGAAGAISGKITAATGGAALGGVRILLLDGSGNQLYPQGSQATASNGTYKVYGLTAGTTYHLCFDATHASGGSSKTGYLSQCYSNKAWNGNPNSIPTTTSITVKAGAVTTDRNAALATGGVVSGKVTDSGTGKPLSGVLVQVFDNLHYGHDPVVASDGTYSVPGLAAGSAYKVCFDASAAFGGSSTTGYLSQCYKGVAWDGEGAPSNGTAVKVSAGSTTSSINAAVHAAGALAGTVTASAGHGALRDVGVELFDGSGTNVRSTNTDAHGAYRFDGLDPTSAGYDVCFDATNASGGGSATGYLSQCYDSVPWQADSALPTGLTPVPVVAGAVATSNAELSSGGAIAGTVTAQTGGAPIGSVQVSVWTDATTAIAYAQTDVDGTYEVTGLAPSDSGYLVCFQAGDAVGGGSTTGYLPQCFDNKPWDSVNGVPGSDATPVPVAAGVVASGTDAALESGAAIAGTVTDSGPQPVGLAGVSVGLYDSAGNSVAGGQTDDSGHYQVNGVPPAQDGYTVCFDASNATGPAPDGYLGECYDNVPWDGGGNSPPAGTQAVPAVSGTVSGGIDAALSAAAAISGKVTAVTGGGALNGVQVYVYTQSGDNAPGSATTAADGTYHFTGLRAGDYTVCFDASQATGGSSTTGYLDECYDDQPWDRMQGGPPPSATTVSVPDGTDVSGRNAALASGGAISGTVVASTGGGALDNVRLQLFDGTNLVAQGSTGADGKYTLKGLRASTGGYYLCFDGSAADGGTSSYGYLGECWDNRPWNPSSWTTLPDGSTPVPVTAGSTTANKNAALDSAGAVAGVVTSVDGGAGLVGVGVNVYTLDGTWVNAASTDDSGLYSVPGLAAGNYLVCFDPGQTTGASAAGYVPQCFDDVAWNSSSSPVGTTVSVVGGASADNVNAALESAAGLSGTVNAAGGTGGLAGVNVQVFDDSQTNVVTTTTAADGSYSVAGLVPGSYTVCFWADDLSAPEYFDQCYDGVAWNGGPVPVGATALALLAGQVTPHIDAALAPAGALSGTVTDAVGGTGLGGVNVLVYDGDGSVAGSATTADDGTYRVGRLPAGSYQVCFDPSSAASADAPNGFQAQCYDGVAWDGTNVPSSATAVAVTAGETKPGVDATLDPNP